MTTLITGCSNSEGTPPKPLSTPPAAQSSAPSAPDSPEASPEPSPVISYLGKTKIVTLGDTEVRATRNALGFNVACNMTNVYDRPLNFRVTVSIGNGKDWVQSTTFDFGQVKAGQTGRETTLMGDSYEGELPDDPKLYIDTVINY
ncbi:MULTISPECIES: hypothetical protein [unclassified Streptomyces]|uniref:hypothetical protein n=1 Tax=unclassified Streptomyces TaxID=2593676 RepID=UPI0035DDE509